MFKRKQMASFTVLYLLALLTFSVFSSVQANGETNAKNVPPDMPPDALQFNRTDITPTCCMESIQAMNMSVFFYKNATLMMNCTRNCEMNVTIDPQVQNRIVCVKVEPNKTMTLALNMSSSLPQGVATVERTLNFYMGLEPNATLQLQAQLKLHINQTELSAELGREVNASRLTWMYWNQTQNQWVAVESYMNQDGYLVCNTDHFSLWTVAELDLPVGVPENLNMFIVVVLAGTVTAVAAVMKLKKRRM
jgi:hypothetical protein